MKNAHASTVLVTGADGLLGSNVVRELLLQGFRVRALVQPQVPRLTLEGLDLEIAPGDLLDPDSLRSAMRGCQFVVHTAGITDPWPARAAKFHAVNVLGTDHLLQVATELGISRMIHVSSSSTLGYGDSPGKPGDERRPWRGYQFGHDYLDTKFISQQRVLQAVAEDHFPAVVINPAFMIGPFDRRPSSGQLLVTAWNQRLALCAPGGKNFVHVRDVAKGVVNGLSRGKPGACYLLGHENLSFYQLFRLIEQVTGKPQPKRVIPAPLLKLGGRCMDAWSWLSGKPPLVSHKMAWMAAEPMYYSPAKAVAELSMPQTPVIEAIREAYQWFATHGYLSQPETLRPHVNSTVSA